MHRFLWFCIIVACLGGFLFGYQTAVIAGAMLFIKKEFVLSTGSHGVVVSIILLGALLGSLVSGAFADRLGRKAAFLAAVLLIIAGSCIAGLAMSVTYLLAGRFLAGIGVGFYSVVTPMYLGEISPLRR